MLMIAFVLALIGLVALVFAVVTTNVLVAWVCVGASALGIVLLIVDAVRDRRRASAIAAGDAEPVEAADLPESSDEADVEPTKPAEADVEPTKPAKADVEPAKSAAESDKPDASGSDAGAEPESDDKPKGDSTD